MSLTPCDAVAAYNAKTKQDFSLRTLNTNFAGIADRVRVADELNRVLQLDGHDQIVWNEMQSRLVGTTPVFFIEAQGYEFLAYIYRVDSFYGPAESWPKVVMRVAHWASVEPYKHSQSRFSTGGYWSINSFEDFGEAVLIHALESMMPDRLNSTNRRINQPSPPIYTEDQYVRLLENRMWNFSRNDDQIIAPSKVEGYQAMLELYEAEKSVSRRICSAVAPKKRKRWLV